MIERSSGVQHGDDDTESTSSKWTLRLKQMNDSITEIVDVDPSSNIQHIKQLTQQVLDIPVAEQRMIFRGKVLSDMKLISEYGINDNDCIHLLRRQRRTETAVSTRNERIQRLAETANRLRTQDRSQALLPGVNTADLTRLVNQQLTTNVIRRGRRANRLGTPYPVGDNIEHIYQSLASIETIDSSLHKRNEEKVEEDDDSVISEISDCIEQSSYPIRSFKVGQWIDCLDTVNQWLEATVTKVSDDGKQVTVHYNGWGTRWDETLFANSPRIARFRTKTKNRGSCRNFSPTISHWVSNTPTLIESNDMNQVVRAVTDSAQKIIHKLNQVAKDDYGFDLTVGTAEKQADVIELAPKLDLIGRALIDLGGALADRPRFKRRFDYLKVPGNLITFVHASLLPYNLKTSIQKDRTSLTGHWNRSEYEEMLVEMGYDKDLMRLSSGSHEVHMGRRHRDIEIHLHAMLSTEIGNTTRQISETVEENRVQDNRLDIESITPDLLSPQSVDDMEFEPLPEPSVREEEEIGFETDSQLSD